MRKNLITFSALLLAASGCHNKKGSVSDSPPKPVVKLAGMGGVTGGLVTDAVGKHAAYLLNPKEADITVMVQGQSEMGSIGTGGELHVASSDGSDIMVTAHSMIGNYMISPGGEGLFFLDYDPTSDYKNGGGTFKYLNLEKSGATATTIIDKTAASQVQTLDPSDPSTTLYLPPGISAFPQFSPSGKYILISSYPGGTSLPDFNLFDVSTGTSAYTVAKGGNVYQQLFLSDDTLFYQNDEGGTTNTTGDPTPPVQALYWTKLPGGAPTKIVERTSKFATTADEKTLVIQTTNGDLFTYDIASKALATAPLASKVVSYIVGGQDKGPVAYVSNDGSVHVVDTSGKALADNTTAAADLLGNPILSPDAQHLYFWQDVHPQDSQGTLMHMPVATGASATMIDTKVSLSDFNVLDQGLVFLDGLDTNGTSGTAVFTALDGSAKISYGSLVPVGGLQVVEPSKTQWFSMHLTNSKADTGNAPITGKALTGSVEFDGSTAMMPVVLDTASFAGGFEFSDDGGVGIFIGAETFNMLGSSYAGELNFILATAPATKIDAKLAGVSELGTVSKRTLFVSAPGAMAPGVYYVKY